MRHNLPEPIIKQLLSGLIGDVQKDQSRITGLIFFLSQTPRGEKFRLEVPGKKVSAGGGGMVISKSYNRISDLGILQRILADL